MAIHVLQVPYDSGHRDRRMGHGPIHLLECGVIECLQRIDGEIHLTPVEVAASFPTEIGTAFELHRTVAHVVARVYVHLDVDVLDAAYAPANQFAPVGGLLPDHVLACVKEIACRFNIAAATVASYDPTYDREDRILHAALEFLTLVASTFRSA